MMATIKRNEDENNSIVRQPTLSLVALLAVAAVALEEV